MDVLAAIAATRLEEHSPAMLPPAPAVPTFASGFASAPPAFDLASLLLQQYNMQQFYNPLAYTTPMFNMPFYYPTLPSAAPQVLPPVLPQLTPFVTPDAAESEHSCHLDSPHHSSDDGTKHRKIWTAEDYVKIIEAYKGGKDAASIASSLGMPLSTAKSIIAKHRKDPSYTGPKPRGGAFHQLYQKAEFMELLVPWLENNNTRATLNEMMAHLHVSHGKVPSRSTLANWLEGELLIDTHRVGYGTPEQISAFEAWQRSNTENGIYISSFNATVWTKRCRSRTSDPHVTMPAQKNANVSTLVASTAAGPLSIRQLACIVTTDDLVHFIDEAASMLLARKPYAKPAIVITPSSAIPLSIIPHVLPRIKVGAMVAPVAPSVRTPSDDVIASVRTKIRSLSTAPEQPDDAAEHDEHTWSAKMQARHKQLSSLIEQAWASVA